uniref:Uncharacterized protein n=1 Tax=Avena sativa TaxID=4498 RepID=A0ACD5TUH4_AVESA
MDQQQPPPGGHAAHGQPLICWEQILQKKTITVLLVETDECTRTAIAAMLRACDYTVIAPKDGKHAWACIQGMHSGIDLVLTEADLSGIELLQRIMDHPVCRTIPVIAMSRSDSVRTVLSCLSKGAVDFLQKPIRKNELRNLWKHVWRRFLNSSGSTSASGSPVQAHQYYYIEPKSGHESNTNTAGSNGRSKGLDPRDDNDMSGGTQAQGSWTKRAVEIDGPQAMSPDQSTEIPDSTCALVIHPISEICNTGWLPDEFKWKGLKIGDHTYANRENESFLKGCPGRRCEYPAHNNSNASAMEHQLEESVVRTLDLIGSMAGSNDKFKEKDLAIDESYPNRSSIKPTNGWCVYPPRRNNSNASTMENLEEPIVGTADLIGSMAKNMDVQLPGRAKDAPNCSSKVPSLELSLKRPRSTGYYANSI